MPNATVDKTPEEIPLKSLEGAFVVLRRMSYGDTLKRRAMMKLSVTAGRKQKSLAGELALASVETTIFEMQCCVVDHNLEDTAGRKLNLTNPNDLAILNPKVGQEIDSLISDMNNFEDEEEDPNSKPE